MNLFERLNKLHADKQEWRAQMKKVHAMPKEYQIVYKEVEKYLFTFAGGNGQDTLAGLYQLIDFLQTGADNQIPVLDYVGSDVGEFAESFRQSLQAESWTEDQKNDMQKRVKDKLDRIKNRRVK